MTWFPTKAAEINLRDGRRCFRHTYGRDRSGRLEALTGV